MTMTAAIGDVSTAAWLCPGCSSVIDNQHLGGASPGRRAKRLS